MVLQHSLALELTLVLCICWTNANPNSLVELTINLNIDSDGSDGSDQTPISGGPTGTNNCNPVTAEGCVATSKCERYVKEPPRDPKAKFIVNTQCELTRTIKGGVPAECPVDECPLVCEDKICSFNAEVALPQLVSNFITPNNEHFVRSHWNVPDKSLLMSNYEFFITDKQGSFNHSYTLDFLKSGNFKNISVTTAIQCGGNRRREMSELQREHSPIKRLLWAGGAIGNAVWTGVQLKDVLENENIDLKNYKHVAFYGLDTELYNKDDIEPENFRNNRVPYKVSIPLDIVLGGSDIGLDPVILAYEMNGADLPFDHGFPLRVVAPGILGARNVKWLRGIELREDTADSFTQKRDYKFLPNTIPSRIVANQQDIWDNFDDVQQMPVQSKVCDIFISDKKDDANGQPLLTVTVRGYAWSGQGELDTVEVSTDNGRTWENATFTVDIRNRQFSAQSWVLWEYKIPNDVKNGEEVEAWSKATDINYINGTKNTQADNVDLIWNFTGVNSNAVSRMKKIIEA